MDPVKLYSRRLFVWVLFFVIALLVLVDAVFYTELKSITLRLTTLLASPIIPPEVAGQIDPQMILSDEIIEYFLPASAVTFFFLGILFFFLLRISFVKVLEKTGYGKKQKVKQPKPASSETTPSKDVPPKVALNNRMFLHLLSVLQREGRLVDFLAEDLSAFDDAQIGAAVRNIHENCKKTMDKYIAPKPVLEDQEGNTIAVPPDFDPDAIKLTGNVTGNPPFTGILRHRGWQATKLNIPTFSGKKDTKVIAPAEVEIQ